MLNYIIRAMPCFLGWYWSGRTSDLHLEVNGCSPSLTLTSFNKVAQY